MTITTNYSARTFAIRKDGSKFRTLPMPRDEFNDAVIYHTII